jgi:hypothetical protein
MHTIPGLICKLLFLPIALSLTVFAVAYAADAPWVLEEDEGGIQIYTRPVLDSPFVEVKASALINAPIAHVALVMGNGESCSEWRAMCQSSEVLRTTSDAESYVYMVLDMPWPLSDRDMVIHSIVQIDAPAKSVTVQLQSASSEHPEQDYVRAITNGQYQLKALGDEQVEFTYIMHTDLGGNLSADIINPRVTASTYEDVRRLQTLAEASRK